MPSKGTFSTLRIDRLSVSKAINRNIREAERLIIERLAYLGEACVAVARRSGNYNDITGNLRSSIGYVVLRGGSPVTIGGTVRFAGASGTGSEGEGAASALLSSLKSEFPKGIVLVVCAGMKYAAYVEDIRHKDVLASAERRAKSLVRALLVGLVN